MAYVYSGLVVGILGNLINEYDNLCRTYCDNVGMLVSNEKEPQTDLRVFSSEQDDQRLLPLSCSERETWSKYNKGNIVSQAGEVEKLNRKLQILEDDTETVKRAFFSSVEERRILIHEIHELFQIIHHFLCLQSKGRDEKTHAGALIIPPHKDRRMGIGLSQVLSKDSNPALVTRGLCLRTHILTFQETTESEEAFIPRDYFFN